jgi:hypothetical protein
VGDTATPEIMLHEGLRHLRDGHESEGIEDLETASAAGWLEARYQLALLYARKGRRRGVLRQQAIGHLERSSLENRVSKPIRRSMMGS